MSELVPREISIMEWLSQESGIQKRAFYLDGRLYRIFDNKGDRLRAVGRANFAAIDVEDGSLDLVLARYGQKEYRIGLTETVVACNDVAILDGASPNPAVNRIHRYAEPPFRFGVSDLDVYMQKRVTMGVVDYRIVLDNIGLEGRKVTVRWASEPCVRQVELEKGGPKATAFTFVNDPENSESLVLLPEQSSSFVMAGPKIAFTQPSVPSFV